MNKLLIASNAVLLSIVLFQATSQIKRGNDVQKIAAPLQPCYRTQCQDYTHVPLKGIINAALAKSMADAYAADVGKAYIKGDTSKHDALSICFEIEKIKNLVWQIEHSVCAAGCDSSLKLGLRMYYAKYPNNTGTSAAHRDLAGLPIAYAGQHTLFMTGVYKKNNTWYDFGFNQVHAGCNFENLRKSQNLNKFFMYTFLEFSSPDEDNHGGLAPPPSPGKFPVSPE